MPGGRPRKYDNREDLQRDIDAYFAKCDNTIIKKQHVTGKGITIVETPTPYTMAGLAVALDMSRETLCAYRREQEYSDIITHARRKIEAQRIEHGLTGCYDSKIAALDLASNHGYATKQDMTFTDTTVRDEITPEELEEAREAIRRRALNAE